MVVTTDDRIKQIAEHFGVSVDAVRSEYEMYQRAYSRHIARLGPEDATRQVLQRIEMALQFGHHLCSSSEHATRNIVQLRV